MKGLLTILAIGLALLVQAGESFSLIEINPLHGRTISFGSDSAKTFYGAGELTGFTEMGGKLYFSAQGTPGNDELWVTDGTQQGTSLVKEINPTAGAALGDLVKVGNRILFMATDNGTDWDLWSTDGTEAGTVKMEELNQPTNTALGPNNISWIGQRLLFCTQQKLLITNANTTGTDSLLSITGYSQGYGYCELNGKSYFILPETSGENEIWRTDGTAAGTEQMLNLADTPFDIVGATEVVSFNGKIYLSATASGQSADLYTFDGNLNGQFNRVIVVQGGNSNPHGFKVYNNALYFIASDTSSSNVYRISVNNPIPAALIPNANFSSVSNLTFANNNAYCMDASAKQIHAIELTGFTSSVLNLNGYTLPYFIDVNKEFLVGANQQIYFEAYDSASGNQVLMQSDFTNGGTQVVMPAGVNTVHPFNFQLSCGIIDVFDLKMWGNKILVPANFNDAGRELWIFDTGIANAINEPQQEELFTLYPNPSSGELMVKTTLCNDCGQNISIINSNGQIVLKKSLSEATSSLQLSSFAPGSYFVTLTQNGRTVDAKQVVLVK